MLENRNDELSAPQVSFVTASGKREQFVWPIDDIVEIKKVSLTSCSASSVVGQQADLRNRATLQPPASP